ncbi:MAG: DUF5060 domain-containing protein, partial [Bacteroidota bacterium]
MKISQLCICALLLSFLACEPPAPGEVSGELKQWHAVTLTFDGPELDEEAADNPFMNYRLMVDFQQGDKTYKIPGYYAADGNAGESSASSGNKWRVHFSPDSPGTWTYTVSFRKGEGIAISDDPSAGEGLELDGKEGVLQIVESDKTGRDFRASGRLELDENNKYYRFAGSGEYFLKTGADSPENFLAYHEFDGTYRYNTEARDGENDPTESLHKYETHVADWKEGDPLWQGDKGKGIIGALNYLAGQGMNAVYFLTMNIEGDGKDVWPYTSETERFRFDCSRLDQWEVVFNHMEQLGLMMHVVTQETENEKLLDGGDTGPERKLYYRELIARFGHHNALKWNLGEENGPASFSPNGQNTEQRIAMTTWLGEHDPYHHPIVLHTHSTIKEKDEILEPLLGVEFLDGLSFQVNKRENVHAEAIKWRKLSEEAGHPWTIGMDEIGFWYKGVMPDAVNPDHDTIRAEVLWGGLLAGVSGVEWYFGAQYAHNDLSCEDWRSRENMWKQTHIAMDFFQDYLPYWEMAPQPDLISMESGYCLAAEGETYVVYQPIGAAPPYALDLAASLDSFEV